MTQNHVKFNLVKQLADIQYIARVGSDTPRNTRQSGIRIGIIEHHLRNIDDIYLMIHSRQCEAVQAIATTGIEDSKRR